MSRFLLFRLYGAMAAWGDTAVGEFRPSQSHPTRTAVLGLVAAALGIRRHQEDKLLQLDNALRVAIHLNAAGEALRDYHTTQVPPHNKKVTHYTRQDELTADKLHTILSSRDYRCNAAATIALQSDNDDIDLEIIKQALLQPQLALFLGRKSCPLASPLIPSIIEADELVDAFVQYADSQREADKLLNSLWDSRNAYKEHTLQLFWEGEESGLKSDMNYPRRDKLRSRKRWQFDQRIEHSTTLTIMED